MAKLSSLFLLSGAVKQWCAPCEFIPPILYTNQSAHSLHLRYTQRASAGGHAGGAFLPLLFSAILRVLHIIEQVHAARSPSLRKIAFGHPPIRGGCVVVWSFPPTQHGATTDVFSGKVEDQHVPYMVPSENGGRADVRWMALRRGEGGAGLLLQAESGMTFEVRLRSKKGWTENGMPAQRRLIDDLIVCRRSFASHTFFAFRRWSYLL